MRSLDDECGSRQSPDLFQRLAADRRLQAEIDNSLVRLIDGLPYLTGICVARVLSTVLEPSWTAHASFQDEALFPILAKGSDSAPEIHTLIERLGGEHAEIGERHRAISRSLDLLGMGVSLMDARQRDTLAQTLALRQLHHAAESVLEQRIPTVLGSTDRAVLEQWMARQPRAPFPANLMLDLWS